MPDFAHELQRAEEAARRAGELAMRERDAGLSVGSKGIDDVVTNVDVTVERFLKERLGSEFPADSLIGEETGAEGDEARRWVIDPVDGTLNLAHGVPLFSVSIALEIEGRPVVGVVYHAHLDELFSARRGGGVHLNGEPVRASSCADLSTSLVAAKPTRPHLEQFANVARACRDVRRLGTAALELAYVACGRLDGFYEYGLQPWDTAAGQLLVEESGGWVSDDRGGAFAGDSPCMVASNGHLHEALLAQLAAR
jgi:myo-inositol-1(or 4)-monophosphatase